jgi:hypothetical protein
MPQEPENPTPQIESTTNPLEGPVMDQVPAGGPPIETVKGGGKGQWMVKMNEQITEYAKTLVDGTGKRMSGPEAWKRKAKFYIAQGELARMNEPRKVGHPRVWVDQELVVALYDYIETVQIPIVKEFTSTMHISYPRLKEIANSCPELAEAVKEALDKKESSLEQGMLYGKLNATGSIFSLKQLGWRDFIDVNNNISMSPERKSLIDGMVNRVMSDAATDAAINPGSPLPPAGGGT